MSRTLVPVGPPVVPAPREPSAVLHRQLADAVADGRVPALSDT